MKVFAPRRTLTAPGCVTLSLITSLMSASIDACLREREDRCNDTVCNTGCHLLLSRPRVVNL